MNTDDNKLEHKAVYIMFNAGSALNNADYDAYDRPSMVLLRMLPLQPNFQGTFDEANLFCELSSHLAGFQAV